MIFTDNKKASFLWLHRHTGFIIANELIFNCFRGENRKTNCTYFLLIFSNFLLCSLQQIKYINLIVDIVKLSVQTFFITISLVINEMQFLCYEETV